MALAIDGVTVSGQFKTTDSVTLTKSTTLAGDVIVVGVQNNGGVAVSSVTSTNLTFTLRKQFIDGTMYIEEWRAIATAALSSEVITVQMDASTSGTAGCFAISGADTVNPYDVNSSLVATGSGSSSVPNVTLSTSNTDTIIFMIGATGARTGNSAGANFTLLWSQIGVVGNANGGWAQYRIVAAAQTDYNPAFNDSITTWDCIGDAVQPPAPGVAGMIRRRRGTSGPENSR